MTRALTVMRSMLLLDEIFWRHSRTLAQATTPAVDSIRGSVNRFVAYERSASERRRSRASSDRRTGVFLAACSRRRSALAHARSRIRRVA